MFSVLTHLTIPGALTPTPAHIDTCICDAHASAASTTPVSIHGAAIAGQRLPFVQYVVSLALVQAIQEHAGARLQVCSIAL